MEQRLEIIDENNSAKVKEATSVSWDDMPPEIIVKIFPECRYQDLYSASLVNKKFYAIASLSLTELKKFVEEAKQQDTALLIANCKSSPKFTQAVIMSAVEERLSDEEIIHIACTSLEHAEIILKSRLIHRYFKSKNNPTEELSTSSEIGNPKFTSISSILDLLRNHYISDIGNIRANDKILMAISNKNIDFAKLVLKHAFNALSGYKLMKIAEFSVAHAEAVCSNSDTLARLKPGHMIGIAQSSQPHLQYILLNHIEKIDRNGIQQLTKISEEYVKTISSCLIAVINKLLGYVVTRLPQTALTVLNLLATEKFFTDINPIWVQHKQAAPVIAAKIMRAILLFQHCFTKLSLNKVLIASLMKQSVKFSHVAFAHPKIHLILGQDLYNKLRNELQNSMTERHESGNVAPSFTQQ